MRFVKKISFFLAYINYFCYFCTAFWVYFAKSGAKLQQKIRMCKKIVKKHQTYLLLLLAVLFSGTVRAEVNNYVGAYGFVGEWSLCPTQSDFRPSAGVGGGAGFLYELQAGQTYSPTRFLFDVGVGVWGGMTSYSMSTNSKVELLNQRDLQGDVFDYIYNVQNRHDQYKSLAAQIPLLIGVQHRKFYMLVGAKVNTHLLTKAYTTADISTYGRYAAIPDLHNMPDYQFFDNVPLSGSTKTSLKLDIDLSLEIGGRLGYVTDAVGYDVPKRKMECRLAAFVDYGLTDMHSSGNNPGFIAPGVYDCNPSSDAYVYRTTSMIDNLQVNDIMSTSKTTATGDVVPFAKSVNNLMVGLKFTILFQLPQEKACVICRDAYRSSVRGRRGGVKYEE